MLSEVGTPSSAAGDEYFIVSDTVIEKESLADFAFDLLRISKGLFSILDLALVSRLQGIQRRHVAR